ncbi:MerR family transcriptional regulator [Pauljensenia sp. 20925_1_34]|uniref:MerR family transcriptional regulator n=1 Tax=Pauljensenia sp. 20925_1_34 TaxID=3003674 RepID=UPI00352F0466
MSNDSTLYTVGDVARRFAVTVRTLRHWEALGLLSPAQRSWSNYRLYSAGDCARVQRIIIYRATGMKLIDIKSLLDSGDTAVEHLKRQRERLVAHRRETAAGLVAAHRHALSEFFPVTPAKHYLISRAYITDERFRSHYDAQQEGFAQWLADAIAHVARASGVDTDNPVWE